MSQEPRVKTNMYSTTTDRTDCVSSEAPPPTCVLGLSEFQFFQLRGPQQCGYILLRKGNGRQVKPRCALLSRTRRQDSCCQSPGVEQGEVKLPTERMSPSDRKPQEEAQMNVSVSTSPAWEAELGGGVNVFLPSARALKCCKKGEDTFAMC